MAKTKTKNKSGSGRSLLHGTQATATRPNPRSSTSQTSTEDLLTQATNLLEQSQPELALPLVDEALKRLEAEHRLDQDIDELLQTAAEGKQTFPQALVLGANVNLALGDSETARIQFQKATSIDPDGALISAEPWLWLSQLCERGGKESIQYFEKGVEVLRNQIEALTESESMEDEHTQQVVDDRRAKLAEALCGMTEVYMTDLSWEVDAEERCEQLVTEAVAVCPERLSAGVLQTLANVRISQERMDEARKILAASMSVWKDLPAEIEDPAKPDFATRVQLTRLLMEVEAETDALFVLDGLTREDDQSVECTYLGGWCHVLLSQRSSLSTEDREKHVEQARIWLGRCLKLYKLQQYEDDRLQAHALELVEELNKQLNIDDDDEEWEDEDDGEDDVDGETELEIGLNGEGDHEDVEMT